MTKKKQRAATVVITAMAIASFSAPAWSITYQYDALGRLVKVVYDDGSWVQYAYDAAGNRTVVAATKI